MTITTKDLAIVVMGVSGSGKSSTGQALAMYLGCRYLEGDTFHTSRNVDKMSQGIPLNDDDRWPWLDRLGSTLGVVARTEGVAVAACSALTRAYRDRLREAAQRPIMFVHVTADRDELARRIQTRPGHYMPASLLNSQLALLEPPSHEELAKTFDNQSSLKALIEDIIDWINKTLASSIIDIE